MAIMYPIYNIWNKRIFDSDVLQLQNGVGQKNKYVRYHKDFEFRTQLPKNLKVGDKVYIYEPKKHRGAGKVVGEFTIGEIVKCDYAFGAFPFIVHFCRNIIQNEDYAQKFERAVKTDLPGYKKGYIVNYRPLNASV